MTSKEIKRIIKDITTNKAIRKGDFPVKFFKENMDLFSSQLPQTFNHYIDNVALPNGLKQ